MKPQAVGRTDGAAAVILIFHLSANHQSAFTYIHIYIYYFIRWEWYFVVAPAPAPVLLFPHAQASMKETTKSTKIVATSIWSKATSIFPVDVDVDEDEGEDQGERRIS